MLDAFFIFFICSKLYMYLHVQFEAYGIAKLRLEGQNKNNITRKVLYNYNENYSNLQLALEYFCVLFFSITCSLYVGYM